MLTVYIWDFLGKKRAWGHASMQVGLNYISWWRDTTVEPPKSWSSHPIRDRRFADDVSDEESQPNHRISINGLDEEAITDWWQSFGLMRKGVRYFGPLLPWDALKLNCSTVVATALRIGGGDVLRPGQNLGTSYGNQVMCITTQGP